MRLLEPPLILLVFARRAAVLVDGDPLNGPLVGAVMLLLAWALEENVPIVAFDAVFVLVSTIVHPCS